MHKRYIISENKYMFGPLHCSKNRERYKEGIYPENMENLTISNPNQMVAEVSFFFKNDIDGTTFLFDPPTMNLAAGESQVHIINIILGNFAGRPCIIKSVFV